MPIGFSIAILFGLIFLLLGIGLYVGLGLAGVGIFGIEFLAHMGQIVGAVIYNTLCDYLLAAIPLFMFMGQIVLRCGLSTRLYDGVSKWTRVIPGGLTHSNILSCAIFAAVSGSSLATAATIGTVAYPEQTKRGYAPSLVTGSLAAGGTLGILIPPSINMIVYGAFVGASIGRLFIGGIIPGTILALLFMSAIFLMSVRNPSLGPPRERVKRRYFLEALIALKDIWPMVLLIVLIMGGIYGGFVTPTEAAGISALVALILAAAFRRLNLTVVKEAALSALQTTAMVMLLILGAQLLGNAVSMLRIPAQLCEAVAGWGIGPLWVWFAAIILYLILGCFMDGLSIMLFTLPVTYPLLVTTLGFNPILFGILLVMMSECCLITPPVGLNLYIIHGIAKGTDMATIIRGVFPFFLVLLVVVALITFFPQLVLYLPSLMTG